MKKTLFSLVLLAMCFCFATGVKAEDPSYTDVSSSSWYYDSVTFLYERGIMSGTSSTTFSPTDSMRRSDFAATLARICKADLVNYNGVTPFTDVPSTSWYAPYVQWAYLNGFMNGTSSSTFSPLDSVTRQQVAVVLYRIDTNTSWFTLPVIEGKTLFADNSSISSSAVTAVYALQQADIVNGDENGCFHPNDYITRAEVAVIETSFYNLYLSEKTNYLLDSNQTSMNAEVSSAQTQLNSIAGSSSASTYFSGNSYTVDVGTFDIDDTVQLFGFTVNNFTFLDGDIIYQQYGASGVPTGHIGIVCGTGILECVSGGIQKVSFSVWKNRYKSNTNYVLRRIPSYCGGNTNCRSVSINAAWYGSWYFLNGAGKNYKWILLPLLSSTKYINCAGVAYKCYRDGAGFIYKICTDKGYYITPSDITPAEIMTSRVYNGFSAVYKF